MGLLGKLLGGKKEEKANPNPAGGPKPGPPNTAGTAGTAQSSTTAGEAAAQHAAKPPGFFSRLLGLFTGGAKSGDGAEAQRAVAERDPGGGLPGNYDEYKEHIEGKFEGKLDALEEHKKKFDAEGGAEKRKTEPLNLTSESVDQQRAAMNALPEGSKDRASKQAELDAMEQALKAGTAGKSMPQLLQQAQQLRDKIKSKGNDENDPEVKKAQADLEGVMHASGLLSKQIDPVGFAMGRELYNEIDKKENAALVDEARGSGMSSRDVAERAVDQRNWSRKLIREELMDPTAAEILRCRDEGKTGSPDGLSFDQVQNGQIEKLQASGKLPAGFDMSTASEEQRNIVYEKCIGSSKKTNAGFNATATGSATGLKG